MLAMVLLLHVLQVDRAPETRAPSLAPGEVCSGRAEVGHFDLPEGATLGVVDDWELHSRSDILIRGDLRALPRGDSDERRDAPSITLRAAGAIHISGAVLGAHGRSQPSVSEALRGGHGSSIVLDAPLILIDGIVWTGDGAPGLAGADGGQGGDLVLDGVALATAHAKHGEQIRTGNGGAAGAVRGERAALPLAGRGGNVQFLRPQRLDANAQRTHFQRLFAPEKDFATQDPCQVGWDGMDGLSGSMGSGGTGAMGANGTAQSPQGGPGGNGGAGGTYSGTPAAGERGGNGADCCPLKGGTGGMGGDAPKFSGGNGGAGGGGGAAYWDSGATPPGYTAPGGVGGAGGPGGSGVVNFAGRGGDGGPRNGDPGAGGTGATANKGNGGAPGDGGRGNPAGPAGTSGPEGASQTAPAAPNGGNGNPVCPL